MSVFSLIHDAWLPVRFADGSISTIAPFDLVTAPDPDNPIISFAWPRADFDLAASELLIGLFAAIYPADPQRRSSWRKLFDTPPPAADLAAAFEPFANAFELDGAGLLFLQDFDPIDGDNWPVDSLFIDAPGVSTVKANKDLFVKRGQGRVLCRAAAAMALYTLQQFAPSGGAGHRTSLRGGGPLVTLAMPGDNDKNPVTLWQKLWLNTPPGFRITASDKPLAFPWLTHTRTSANKEAVHDASPNVHGLQAFFGMPRRIRLIFEPNAEARPCSLMGIVDETVCTGFVTAPWGVNYGVWRHPLTPYYWPKANSNEPPLPVHAPEDRLGYRQWLGFVFQGDGNKPAESIVNAVNRLDNLGGAWSKKARLLAAGYAMDNMKPLAFAVSDMPLHEYDPDTAEEIARYARLMVNGAAAATKMLGLAVKRALYGEKAEVKFDSTPLETARERLWELTETDFHHQLDDAIGWLHTEPDSAQTRLQSHWRRLLQRAALSIFDDSVPFASFDTIEPGNIVAGRMMLVLALEGYGKLGNEFFKALGLDPPSKKPLRPSDDQTKEDRP